MPSVVSSFKGRRFFLLIGNFAVTQLTPVFEHEIDLSVYLDAGLTSADVWRGLESFALEPHKFIEHMHSSRVTPAASDAARRLLRRLDFNPPVIEDVVELDDEARRLTIFVPATDTVAESELVMQIVEARGLLKIAFRYFGRPLEGAEASQIEGLLHKAWLMKDRDIVRRILARTMG